MLASRSQRHTTASFVRTLLILALFVVSPVFGQSEPTPLMPHPIRGRPVFSQDVYDNADAASSDEKAVEPPAVKFSQDQFDDEKAQPSFADELRQTPAKGREQSEVEIAKGIIKLNAGELDDAEKHFKQALTHDPRNFVALEYRGAVSEARGKLEDAIGWFVKAKRAAPEARWGAINFQIGRLYLFQRNYERGEIYLKLAIDQGGQLTASYYTLGYLYFKQGRFFEAHDNLERARERAVRPTARSEERATLQPIYYYLGEIYARLGFTEYAVSSLRETEFGPSWEIRNAAWRIHSELNHAFFHLNAGAFLQYDSNTVLLPSEHPLPTELSSKSSFNLVTTVDGGWQTSPAKKWIFGADGALYSNTHASSEVAGFDVLSIGGDVWIDYWNQRNWRFSGRYDLGQVFVDRTSFDGFETNHGPGVSAAYTPFMRWSYEVGFNYRLIDFNADLPTGPNRRNGSASIAFLRVGLKAPNPRLRPQFGYTFEYDEAAGDNFDARVHTLSAELAYRLFSKTHLVGSVQFSKYLFPNHITGRDDTRFQARVGANHILSDHWLLMADLTELNNNSTSRDFTFTRFTFTSGVMYRL